MSNVIPIRGEKPPSEPPKPPRRRRSKKRDAPMLWLRESSENDGFATIDAVNGLRGVCQALEQAAVFDGCSNTDKICNLAMAANVLSAIVAYRVEIGGIGTGLGV